MQRHTDRPKTRQTSKREQDHPASPSTQNLRHLGISTCLGPDRLLLVGLSGREELSRPFSYELELLSEDLAIEPGSIVGTRVTFAVRRDDGTVRHFNGFVKKFAAGRLSRVSRFRRYRAEVVPWLWFLTQTTDCRIFQRKSVPAIIAQVFEDLGFSEFSLAGLRQSYPPRDYCVQYRETDFDFVCRLMEEEGIFFHFIHEEDKHVLAMADSPASYLTSKQPLLTCQYTSGQRLTEEMLTSWERQVEFRTGRIAHTDYDFKKPSTSLIANEATVTKLIRNKDFEQYDYPGVYRDVADGRRLARVRMEEQEADQDLTVGEGVCRVLNPGEKFTLVGHEIEAENQKTYLVTSIEHEAEEPAPYETSSGNGEQTPEAFYRNRFTCIPAATPFRPARITPKARVEGPHTAVVVGPPGEEIYTNEHGEVKVQFHWDREGRRDEDSSCWIRVSQPWAGAGFGGMAIPRVGQEVIVDFLEGNPDRPIITGRVYNASQMPPQSLPGAKVRTSIRSNTYPGGGGCNEITMDDSKGKEHFYEKAQYDKTVEIGNNRSTSVGVDSTEVVGNNMTLSVGNNKSTDVTNAYDINCDTMMINAKTSITLQCGASRIHMNQAGFISITGTVITSAATVNNSMVAPMTEVVGAVMLTQAGAVVLVEGGATHVRGEVIAALKGATVNVVAQGDNVLQGGQVKIN